MLEFRILGPLEVIGDDGPIALGGPKQRATLAILLLDRNRVVSVDRLADDLYSGAAPVTAVTQVQRQISELRKLLGAEAIETRAPGYAIKVGPGQLDLERFEQHAEAGARAAARGDARAAADLLADALGLWRGPPLADLTAEPFAQISIERLEEIKLAALEQRIQADLELGNHLQLVPELVELVAAHPVRERFRAQLMLALYRSGRQAEALDVYRSAREALVHAFGIEPTPALRELERAILTQDPSLTDGGLQWVAERAERPGRSIIAAPSTQAGIDRVVAVAEPLARSPGRELIVARLVPKADLLQQESAALNARRGSMAASSRVAAFTTEDWAGDLVRLAAAHDAELIILDVSTEIEADMVPAELATLLDRSPTDVAMVAGPGLVQGAGVFVPFGGSEHDWAALELGAWLAVALDAPLQLVGRGPDPHGKARDASRLLADAALAVQRVVRVDITPVLAPSGEGLSGAVDSATIVVTGMSPRWRREGIGAARSALVRGAHAATLLVHRGPRPGGLAPHGGRTRYSWSIEVS